MRIICPFVSVFFLIASAAPAMTHAVESSNQWYLRGPSGGYANQVGIDPVSQRPLTGGIAGVFRYDTLASAWDYTNTGAPTPFVGGIATTPTATFINSGGYVARSTDGGVTWTNVGNVAMGGKVSSLATSAASATRVYASVNPQDPTNSDLSGGLWISNDLGTTWSQSTQTSGANLRLVRASPTDANLIFLAGSPDSNSGVTNLFRSGDAGVSFTGPVIQSGGTPSLPLEFLDVAQDPFDTTKIVALTAPAVEAYTDKSQGGEVWVSTDAGLTWGSANINQFLITPETSGGGEPRALLFDRFTANVIYVATTWGVYKAVGNNDPVLSSSGMLQMGPRNSGAQPYDEVDGLTQANDGTLYAATTSGGVYKSTNDGKTWALKNEGITQKDPFAWRIVRDPHGVLYLLLARRSSDGSIGNSGDGALYKSTNGADSWTPVHLPDGVNGPNGLAIDPRDPQRLYLAAWPRDVGMHGEGGGVYLSTNGGQSWTSIFHREEHVYDVTINPRNPDTVYAAGYDSSAWISSDRGTHWRHIAGPNFHWMNRVIPDPYDPAKIYISTFGGSVWHGDVNGEPGPQDIVTPKLDPGR